jgi:hypothetical protein
MAGLKRILLRAPKTPFDVLTPEQTLASNALAGNAGNLVFIEAAWKMLDVPGAQIVADRLNVKPSRADEINEQFDVYVIPLANAFRLSYESQLAKLTELVRRLRIQVVVLGVGAQGTVDYDWSSLRPMEATVRAFMGAVLDCSPSVGVRGEGTLDYLAGLGFRDVEVIGCPSMFMWADGVRIRDRVPVLERESRVAITISPYRPAMGPISRAALERYPHLAYIAQDRPTLELLLTGHPLPGAHRADVLPVHPAHALFRERRTRFYTDPWPWIADLRTMDYVFGTRIHGTIAALLAGTPATVLAHDSRTLELARHFAIPHRLLRDARPDLDPAELYGEADTSSLVAGHPARLSAYLAFLERHGLDHAHAHPWAFRDFERRVAATPYPGAVTGQSLGARDPWDTVRLVASRVRQRAADGRQRRAKARRQRRA